MAEHVEHRTVPDGGSGRAPSDRRGRGQSRKAGRRGGARIGCFPVLLMTLILMVLSFAAGFLIGKNTDFDEGKRSYVNLSEVRAPEWIDQDFIDISKYSRPGIKIESVNDIVIHYVANPGSTAAQNRSYFAGLANQTGSGKTFASCHFIIGLDGEIVQIIPIDEKAYASNNRNSDTVAIECCHPDDSGAFTDATYESLVKLTAWLCGELSLSEKDLIRHYDVNGKLCPKYFVEHEDAWTAFKQDVKKAIR